MKERQTTFGGGEFSPTLWGRTDYQRYASGARKLLNFFVEPHGAASNRPGTLHVARTKNDGAAVFVPFVFSDEDVVLLVFTHLALRFYRLPAGYGAGTTAVDWSLLDAGGVDLEKATPYDESEDLTKLRAVQLGNVMRIMHPNYAPYELRRLAADGTDWLLEEISFDVAPFPGYGGEPRINHSHYKIYNETPTASSSPLTFATTLQPQSLLGDATHLPDAWVWKVTRIMKDVHGREYETLPFTVRSSVSRAYFDYSPNSAYNVGDPVIVPELPGFVFFFQHGPDYALVDVPRPTASPDAAWWTVLPILASSSWLETATPLPQKVALATDWAQTITWRTGFNNLLPDTVPRGPGDDEIVATRIYRGLGGFYGFMGEVRVSDGDSFTDIGVEPIFSDPPPLGQNPLEVFDETGALVRTERPSVSAFFQGRFLMAATPERPNLVLGSAAEDYENYDKVLPPDDADAYSFELAARKLEAIKAIIPGRVLLLMTSSSEWEVTGSNGELITPLSIAARPVSSHGCSGLEPLVAQSTVLFVPRVGGVPLAMAFSLEGGGYQATDIAEAARHLFVGHTIVSWAYAENPHKLLYVVRDDGVLLIGTYDPRQEMRAWTQHELAGDGLAEWVTTLPEGNEDGVYMLVNRAGVRTIERLHTRLLEDIREAMFLDAAVKRFASYDGSKLQVTEYDDLYVGSACKVRFSDPAGAYELGLPAGTVAQVEDPDGGEPARVQIISEDGGGIYSCVVLATLFAALVPEGVVVLFEYTECFQALDASHLADGTTVMALTDGNVAGPLTVAQGQVDLGVFAAIACIGLPYVSDLISLDIVADKAKPKAVRAVTLETDGSRGGYVGDSPRPNEEIDQNDMEEIRDREVEHSYGPIPMLRKPAEHIVPSEWKETGGVALRQVDPLPLTVLGITRDVEIGKPE